MKISKKLFDTAIKDLETAEILYNAQHFNTALFQLQQSVEKLVKSFGIETKSVKPEEISNKINHLPHKVFTRLYQNNTEKLEKLAKPPRFIPEMVPPHQRNKTEVLKQIERTKELRLKILDFAQLNKKNLIDENTLLSFISGGKDLEKLPEINEQALLKEIEEDFIKTNEHFIKYFEDNEDIKEMSKDFIKNSKNISLNKLELRKKEIIRERKYGYVEYVWINLSLLTSPHEQSTRYPSIVSELAPQEIYNTQHVIVKYLPELFKMLKKSIENYKYVYGK